MSDRERLRVAVIGLGGRGETYTRLLAAEHADRVRVTQVAEPRFGVRQRILDELATEGTTLDGVEVYDDWQSLLAAPRNADVAIVCVQDRDHREVVEAFAAAGYDLLCEKPLAGSEADCAAMVRAADTAGVFLGVCHVLRYTPNTRTIRRLLDDGAIGQLVAVQHLEPVGWFHFAHSFVRGPWRRTDESGPLLLTKSCHDIDWLSYIVGAPALKVSSFGSRSVFRPEAAPDGAGERCVSCDIEPTCPYSAVQMYARGLAGSAPEAYFTRIIAPEATPAAVDAALRDGPFGRCVWRTDNDVVDHQVVNLEYAGGVTASFTLAAFTPMEHRHTKLFGSHGQITSDGDSVEVFDFVSRTTTTYDTADDESGHGGGDAAMLAAYLDAVIDGANGFSSTGDESLATHQIVFAAERARATGRVVELTTAPV